MVSLRILLLTIFRLLLIVTFLLPGAGIARAAAPVSPSAPDAESDIWRTHTNANWINDLAIEGSTIWAATDGGLVRWNREPASYQKFLTTDGLPSAAISSIAVDGNGVKWIGTSKGLVRYDDAIFITYNTTNSDLVNNAVNDIAIEGNGDLWICTSGGVNRLSGTTWTRFTTNNSGLASNSVISLAIEGGVKWFGTSGSGISRFDGATWTTTTPGSGSIANTINAIAVDQGGVKWFGAGNPMGSSGSGEGALYSFDNTTWTTYTISTPDSELASNNVFSLAVDDSGAKWIGTEYGLNRFDGSTWNTYTQQDGLAADWVSALAPDSGEVWAGTAGGGISLRSTDFHTYRTTDELPHNSLFMMSAQGNDVWFSGGDTYVISQYNGLSKYNGVTWTHYRYGDSGLSMPEVYDVEEAPGGLLWVVGRDINTFDGVNWALVSDPYANGIVKQVAIDGGVQWFYSYEPSGTLKKWVSRYDGSSWTAYPSSEIGLPLNSVRTLAVDANHNIWLSTSEGVAHYNGSSWTVLTTSNSGLPSNSVYDIEIDPVGSLWFTTSAGVSHYASSTWTTYNTSNSGLSSNRVYAAAIDRYGRKWFATANGVSVMSGQTWSTYDKFNSGLADNMVHNVVITSNDHKWFSTASGVSELYQPSLAFNYTSGAPGSYFNVVGSDFPPDSAADLTVNGYGIGGIVTNASGVFTATISTSGAGLGWYYLTAQVSPPGGGLSALADSNLQATGLFTLEAAGVLHPQEGSYPIYNVPAGSALLPTFLPILKK